MHAWHAPRLGPGISVNGDYIFRRGSHRDVRQLGQCVRPDVTLRVRFLMAIVRIPAMLSTSNEPSVFLPVLPFAGFIRKPFLSSESRENVIPRLPPQGPLSDSR